MACLSNRSEQHGQRRQDQLSGAHRQRARVAIVGVRVGVLELVTRDIVGG